MAGSTWESQDIRIRMLLFNMICSILTLHSLTMSLLQEAHQGQVRMMNCSYNLDQKNKTSKLMRSINKYSDLIQNLCDDQQIEKI